MKYLVVAIFINDVEKSELCVTYKEAIETYNRLCNYYYNDDALEEFMQNNNYEENLSCNNIFNFITISIYFSYRN